MRCANSTRISFGFLGSEGSASTKEESKANRISSTRQQATGVSRRCTVFNSSEVEGATLNCEGATASCFPETPPSEAVWTFARPSLITLSQPWPHATTYGSMGLRSLGRTFHSNHVLDNLHPETNDPPALILRCKSKGQPARPSSFTETAPLRPECCLLG